MRANSAKNGVSVANDSTNDHKSLTKSTVAAWATIALLAIVVPAHAQVLPYLESFTDQLLRDDGQTTADWGVTMPGQLILPSSPSLTGLTFDETTTVEVIPGVFETRAVALADLDGDGDLDLIDGSNGPTGINLNDGAGNFGPRISFFSLFANTRSIAVGDVDRDGDLDIVEGNLASPGTRVFLNDVTGTNFNVMPVVNQGFLTNEAALADINGDGLLDVVLANEQNQANRLVLNTGDPLAPFGPNGSAGIVLPGGNEFSRHVVTGDLDDDGDIDIVFLNDGESNLVAMNLLDGFTPIDQVATGSFADSIINHVATDSTDDSLGGSLGDMDGDGDLDLVVINYGNNDVSKIYFNDAGAATNTNPFTSAGVDFHSPFAFPAPENPIHSVLADADNDGDLDIFVAVGSRRFRNQIYFNDGSGTMASTDEVGPTGQAPLDIGSGTFNVAAAGESSAVGDVDGDGDLDWVVGHEESLPPTGAVANALYRNTGVADITVAQQLNARATSSTIDNTGVSSVKLSPVPNTSLVGPADHNFVDYWVSGDGGATWSVIGADGRPVALAAGNDLRWRATLRSESPLLAGSLAVNQLDIIENTSGPTQTDLYPNSRNVTEDVEILVGEINGDYGDADGDTVYYSITGWPVGTGLTVDQATGDIIGTPTEADALASPISLTLTITDGAISVENPFQIVLTVAGINDPPEFTSTAIITATEAIEYSYPINVIDADNDPIEITEGTVPAWLTLTDNGDGTATLVGTPSGAEVGDHPVQLLANDSRVALPVPQDFTITVVGAGDAPTITLVGPATVTIEVGDTYADAGATASDPQDGDLTAQIVVDNPVDSDTVGTYTVTYTVQDSAGNPAQAQRTVIVQAEPVDQPPTITLNGDATVTITEGDTYTDAGATATDAEDGDLTAQILVDNPVDSSTPGTYMVTYTVQDSGGTEVQAQRTVIVEAAPPPPPPPPPPPSGGGGGSMGLVELLAFALLGLAIGSRRRRVLQRR